MSFNVIQCNSMQFNVMCFGCNTNMHRNSNGRPSKTVGLGHGANQLKQSQENHVKFSDKEEEIRTKSNQNVIPRFLKSNLASLLVFCFYLIRAEGVLSCLLTVGLTLYWYFFAMKLESGEGAGMNGTSLPEWSGSGIDWVVLGFGAYNYLSYYD